jgi:hypothetical protein
MRSGSEALERQIEDLGNRLADPELYAAEGEDTSALNEQLRETQAELERAFERWSELDARQRA